MLIAGYSFGTDDQAQYLVHVLTIEHPDAFPQDAYPAVFDSLGSLFWYPVAWLSTDATRPAFLLGLTLAITMLNVELLRRLGRVLIGEGLWAFVPALLLVVPKERNWFGLVGVCDHELTATMGVLPCVFGAMLAWVRGRPFLALVLCVVAVPIHAQTGAALLATWWAAVTLLAVGDSRWRVVSVVVGVFGMGSVLLASLALHLPPETRDLCRAAGDDLFVTLIDPLTATPEGWASVGTLLLLGLIAAFRSTSHSPWERAGMRVPFLPLSLGEGSGESAFPPSSSNSLLILWCLASLAFPLVGTALHALGLNDPLLWRLMVGRGFLLPQIGAIVLIALWCSRCTPGFGIVITAAVLVVLAWWPFADLPMPIAMSVLSFIVIAMLARPSKAHDRANPNPNPDSDSHPPARPDPRLVFAAVIPIVILARFGITDARWLDTHADPAWREVQVWAHENTAPDALFITPPYLSAWRLESLRTTFGEGKDGGLAFYADDMVLEWSRRMDLVALGRPCNWELWEAATIGDPARHAQPETGRTNNTPLEALVAEHTAARDNYHAALRANLDTILAEFNATYVVTEADLDLGEVVWHNDRFWISQVQ